MYPTSSTNPTPTCPWAKAPSLSRFKTRGISGGDRRTTAIIVEGTRSVLLGDVAIRSACLSVEQLVIAVPKSEDLKSVPEHRLVARDISRAPVVQPSLILAYRCVLGILQNQVCFPASVVVPNIALVAIVSKMYFVAIVFAAFEFPFGFSTGEPFCCSIRAFEVIVIVDLDAHAVTDDDIITEVRVDSNTGFGTCSKGKETAAQCCCELHDDWLKEE